MGSLSQALEDIHYRYAPPVFIVAFTLMAQIIGVYGTTDEGVTWSIFGNTFSWTAVAVMTLWSLLSLWVPGKEYRGPATASGFIPVYRANGFQYFCVSASVFGFLLIIRPQIAVEITENFPQILASCNILAFAFCIFLLVKGKSNPSKDQLPGKYPIAYEFYRGMEIHPVMLGVDVKQLTICRFGLMAWLLLDMSFVTVSWLRYGFSFVTLVSTLLQAIYLAKFYWWETGYFNTLDIILDRAGYYLCWGCIVWVPALFTLTAYYLASRPPLVDNNVACVILFFGIVSTIFNYWVDMQKEYFRSSGGKCQIWFRAAKFIKAPYKTEKGTKYNLLLISGFWGVARHLNYVFELCVAFSWSLPCVGYGIWPFAYPIFLTCLVVHRVFRDEKKCAAKYGDAWNEYCQKVPYRMIPGIF